MLDLSSVDSEGSRSSPPSNMRGRKPEPTSARARNGPCPPNVRRDARAYSNVADEHCVDAIPGEQ